jgi:hypothetical protein
VHIQISYISQLKTTFVSSGCRASTYLYQTIRYSLVDTNNQNIDRDRVYRKRNMIFVRVKLSLKIHRLGRLNSPMCCWCCWSDVHTMSFLVYVVIEILKKLAWVKGNALLVRTTSPVKIVYVCQLCRLTLSTCWLWG